MKMGEVVEDANISQQVASSVVVDDEEDEDDAANEREVKEYCKKLNLLLSSPPPDEDCSESEIETETAGERTSKSSSGEKGSCRTPFSPFSQLPRHLDKKRRILKRKHLELLKRSSLHGNLQSQLKAKKEFELKFLEATYVRNVLFQSFPHLPVTDYADLPTSVNPADKSKCGTSGDNNTNQKLDATDDRTFCNDDAHCPVPNPSAISVYRPYSGAWFDCLKAKAMNEREPNHLLQVAYDNFVAKDAKALWLSKQPKKSSAAARSPITPEKGPAGVPTPADSSKGSESPSRPVNSSTVNSSNLSSGEIRVVEPVAVSGSGEEKADISATPPGLMLSRSPEKDKISKEDASEVVSLSPSTPSSFCIEESTSTSITLLTPTKDVEKGRKSAAGLQFPTSFGIRKAGGDTPKAGSTVSSISSELSVKSVISENTDSSSSTSTSVSSSSLNESVSIGIGRNSFSTPPNLARGINNSGSGNLNNSCYANASGSTPNHGNARSGRKSAVGPKPPKKYSEKMKAEASVLQRISELQKEGMWWERRLPKVCEPPRAKSHWDYLLEEMTWMSSDFVHERKWKRNAAKKCARMIEKYFHEKEQKRLKAEKDEEIRKRRTAATIAKLVRQFWSNVQTVVEFKEQSIIDSMRKKALDQKLSFLVNETEKYSEIVAHTFTAVSKKARIDSIDALNEDSRASDDTSVTSVPTIPANLSDVKDEVASPLNPTTDEDVKFVPPSDSESDVDDTIAEEEAKERERGERPDHSNELEELEAENSMSYEEILAKYAKYLHNPEAYKVAPEEPKAKQPEGRITRGRTLSGRQLRATRRREPVKVVESEVVTEVDENDDTSSTEEESEEDAMSEADKSNDDLASLLKSISSDAVQKKNTEEETNKLADLAESFKPKGYTLSSTTVVTKVPHLLRHTLREYQHIGLDWLVTMYDKRLNGILADEMGLGKTIQTIALLAYLAVERCNWGPHLIIVPTSVMLNWEMEFKKWCPGFKILTYYGSQKERKLKRSGWTKPNAFHVCITSYKLVIQDHQSFRRKRWKYLILDEAQNIKNFKSQRWQLLLNFNTQRRLLLTGTPLQNKLMELWSLLHFLMPNVFQSHMEFKDWFSNPMSGMVEGSQEYNDDIVRRLHKVLRPFILRRMKSEVEKQLPQKYEHVVMCSLSKRQRFLYEEFMSRTKTRDTLNQGNLLSVINVLMQLRKVCNHPNLFEPRPIVSPFQTEGINCNVPSLAWDVLRELQEDSFHQRSPLFTISNPDYSYSEYASKRIGDLTPLFAYNPDEERRYVLMNYIQCVDSRQPAAKRIRRIVNLVKSEPPECPKVHIPLSYFMSNQRPDRALEDSEFVECLRDSANAKKLSTLKLVKDDVSDKKTESPGNNGKPSAAAVVDVDSPEKPVTIDLSDGDSDKDYSTSDSEVEIVVIRRRKVAKKFDVSTRLHTMGCTVPDFELRPRRRSTRPRGPVFFTSGEEDKEVLMSQFIEKANSIRGRSMVYRTAQDTIQERRLQDRKTVVNNLNKVNWTRCRVHTYANQELDSKCQLVGTLPPLRLTSRKTGCRRTIRSKLLPGRRDYESHGYFNLGFNEIMRLIKIREEGSELLHHPLIMWSMTKHLDSLVLTPQSRLNELMSVLKRYVMYIPAVSAPALEGRMYRPSSSMQYFSHLRQLDEYKNQFSQSTDIVHPIVSRMLTQFPDPRLIQYDCGKLQTLDTLLRRLKTGNHRVLIFTQMAKVLDILEAFLNYHGHTYLRLDGATKIDQRQLLMERFNADKKIFCFILSTRSGGIGVNLTGADTVIFYDSDWNPTMDAQAQDRCHRIGQTRDVHIYRLVSEKTVEENILKKSNQKRLLGELAIEGGKFTTTYFKQHTIRDLFTINEKDDVAKRLNAWDSDQNPSGSKLQNNEEEDESSFNPMDLMRSPDAKRNRMHVIECALAAAEDDTDVQAAQTVHAEAEAEMAEFDENVSLDALDDGKSGPNKFELEFQQVYDQLTDVERYALRLMESTIDDWSKETVAQAQKDLEEQKLAWELQQQKTTVKTEYEDDNCSTEDLLTYSRVDPLAQVWVAQFGNYEQEMLFPCLRNTLELPLNLLLVNLAQTPNWDYAQETVNTISSYHRTWKQCKWRYENIVAPREEGKLLFDSTSSSDPGSPSSGKKKKAKAFIKITPPSPSKAARNVKLSQLMTQDNNAQFRNSFSAKFDTIKTIANKRAPTKKPAPLNPQIKNNKHSQIITDFGINYENPLPATAIAQARYDRIQLERKKIELQRQQQAAAAAAASASGAAASSMGGVPTAIISGGPAAVAAAISAASANASPSKSRPGFTAVTLSGQIAPLVIQTNNPDIMNRDENIPNIIAQQRSRQAELAQQQQQVAFQRQALAAQAQSLTSLLNQQPQVSSQQSTAQQGPPPNVTVLTSGPVSTTQSLAQQTLRTPPPPVHQTSQASAPTVVLASGLAQALAASVGSGLPISVSSSTIQTSAPLPSTVSTTTTLPTSARALQPSVTTQTQLQRVPTITMQDLVSSATSTQRFQTTSIITTSTPSGPPQSQQSQPTLVSLTPMMGSSNPQLTKKLIQNSQGIATLVQSSPTRTGASAMGQQAGNKMSPVQLQYLKQGMIRPSSPVSASVQQQQQQHQVQQIKDQLMHNTQQIKRIQVVAASPPPTIVSSSAGGSQPPPSVSLPPVSTIPNVSTYSTLPVVSATSSPVVTISSAGTTSKVSLTQPHVTIMQCQSSSNVIPQSHVIQQQAQRQLQLVKQHTVGGKTVTRPVSEAEVAAFLKQHGMSINYPQHSGIPVTKTTPVATYQGPVSVQGQPTLLTVGLQNLMKVHQTPSGSVATLVKSTGGQAGQQSAGGALTYPVHVSKVGSKGTSPTAGTGSPKQQATQPLNVQQVMIQRRQQDQTQLGMPQPNQGQQQTMQAATTTSVAQTGKIAHITTSQVPPPGAMPTHVVVQTSQKQLPNTIAVQQLQQVFKQVGATGQVISQGGQVLQPQIIGKPTPNSITVTTSATTNSAGLTMPQSATSTAASLVHIPSSLVQAGSSPIHARIVPVSVNLASQQAGGVKQTIQVVSAPPPNAAILGPGGSLTLRQNPNQSPSTPAAPVNHTIIHTKLPSSLQPPEENN